MKRLFILSMFFLLTGFSSTDFQKENLKFLEKLAYAACQMDWRKLKVHRQLPNLREIVKVERETIERKNREEILAIENELGFSLY